MIQLKRIYEQPEKRDGCRILVDRLWPRGVSKERAAIDLWYKDIAPSNALRKWYGHDPKKWPVFQKKYASEIAEHSTAIRELQEIVKQHKAVTLLYAARDEAHNEAVVIRDMLTLKRIPLHH